MADEPTKNTCFCLLRELAFLVKFQIINSCISQRREKLLLLVSQQISHGTNALYCKGRSLHLLTSTGKKEKTVWLSDIRRRYYICMRTSWEESSFTHAMCKTSRFTCIAKKAPSSMSQLTEPNQHCQNTGDSLTRNLFEDHEKKFRWDDPL